MVTQLDNLKVLDAIVMAVAILVMHMFSRQQGPTEMLFHHYSMFTAPLAFDLDLSVRSWSPSSATWEAESFVRQVNFGKTGTGAVLSRVYSVCWNPYRCSATDARDVGAIESCSCA